MSSQSSNNAPSQLRRRVLAGLNGRAWRADIRRKPLATETPGRGVDSWLASIVGLGAGARRRHAQLQLPAHSMNKKRGGLRRIRLGVVIVTGGTGAVTETSATASAVHLPATSPGDIAGLGPVFAGMMPTSASSVGA